METMSVTPEILEHARGAMTFGIAEPAPSVSSPAAHKSKLFRTVLKLASASELGDMSYTRNWNRKPLSQR